MEPDAAPEREAAGAPPAAGAGGRAFGSAQGFESIEAGLGEFLPGLTVLDRALELGARAPGASDSRRADFVCRVDPGRMALVLFVDGESEEAWLAALDALAYGSSHSRALAQHVGADTAVVHELEPLVVLVARCFAPHVRAGLAGLPADRVRLFELTSVATEGATHDYLRPVDPRTSDGAWRARTTEAFLTALAEPSRSIARRLVARVPRIDADLELVVLEDALHWRVRGRELGALWSSGDRLAGAVSTTNERVEIGSDAHGELFLTRLLVAHCKAFSEPFERAKRDAEPGARKSGFSEPLLTAEEIEAFRV